MFLSIPIRKYKDKDRGTILLSTSSVSFGVLDGLGKR